MVFKSCNWICIGFKAKRIPAIPIRYSYGQKKDRVCAIFIKCNETTTPVASINFEQGSLDVRTSKKDYREMKIKRY